MGKYPESKEGRPNGNGGIPVHDMPDFMAALQDYVDLLRVKGVPQEDINTAVTRNIDGAETRKRANDFINFIAQLKPSNEREQIQHHQPSELPSQGVIFEAKRQI